MIVFMKSTIGLTEGERRELRQRAASRSGRADDGRRARLILLLAAGHSWAQIRDKLSCNDAFIARWSKRFGRERLAGLFSRHDRDPTGLQLSVANSMCWMNSSRGPRSVLIHTIRPRMQQGGLEARDRSPEASTITADRA